MDFQPTLPLAITDPRPPGRAPRADSRGNRTSKAQRRPSDRPSAPQRDRFAQDWRLDEDTRVAGRQGLKIARAALAQLPERGDRPEFGDGRHSNAA